MNLIVVQLSYTKSVNQQELHIPSEAQLILALYIKQIYLTATNDNKQGGCTWHCNICTKAKCLRDRVLMPADAEEGI